MKFHYLIFFLSILPLKAMSPVQAEYYVHTYAAPSYMREELDAECDSKFPFKLKCTQIGRHWLKRDATRLQGMELIRNTAQVMDCENVIVPNKYIYTRPNGVFFIVAEGITEKNPQHFTQKLIKELYKIAKATGYWDLHEDNIKVTSEGKVAFLDTEMLSFDEELPNDRKTKLAYLENLSRLAIDKEAEEYIFRKVKAKKEEEITSKRRKHSSPQKNY